MSNSEEEEIARNYICFGNPDATIVVVDSTCLERNLNLVFQILEITNNVILCVNLLDEAKKKKIKIDLSKLSCMLGIPVVGTIAQKKKTLETLMETTLNICQKKIVPKPHKIEYSSEIEDGIALLEDKLSHYPTIPKNLLRWIALKVIDGDKKILKSIEENFSISIIDNVEIQLVRAKILNKLQDKNSLKDSIVSSNYEKIRRDLP